MEQESENLTADEIEIAKALQKCKEMYEALEERWYQTDNTFIDAIVIAQNAVLSRTGCRQLYYAKQKEGKR